MMQYNVGRRQFLKTLSAGMAGASAFSLSGCESQPVDPNQIRMGVTSRPRILDPRKATDALSSRVNRLIYRQLIDFNEAFEPIPDLTSWEQLSATHYRFTLLERPLFHHGKRLDAQDVVATFRTILNKSFGSPLRGSLKHIRSVVALNDTQVDFHLRHDDALFVGRLVIGILPKDLIDQAYNFNQHPIGCGACRFESMTEQCLILKRPDEVELHFIPVKDATVRVLKLRKGELDLIQNDLSPELLAYSQKRKDLNVMTHNGTSFGYIGFNFDDPLLNDLSMRRALAYGIDRQAIIDSLFSGQARLAGGLLVPEHWCGAPQIHGYDYHPQKAKALVETLKQQSDLVKPYLNEAGEITLSYKTSSDPTRIRLATIYQSQLKRIGINLKIQSYDWGTFYNDIKQGRFQLYSLAWVGVKSPDIFQYVFDSNAVPPKGANRGRYRDPIADELIREAGAVQSHQKQAELYRQLQVHLQETLAAMPLWYENQYAVMRPNLSGYRLYSDGRFDGLLTVRKTA
ncbi:MAG: ABC transporter substrate-binding protein [Hydrogenovibrio sp.]|nr:ABC transporter substrate-binding protein [Hydrogenovibrio sp.]